MGWFGFGGQHEPYNKDGKAQLTTTESAAMLNSLGTNDLDQLIAAAAPTLTKVINNQTKGLRETKQMVAELTDIIKKQNQQIENLNKKIETLTR
ncbi:hypothetical protein [Anaerovibrio sp.]|uniref:hypothetical protein n=1 Tax=Anaerovibrio sp. TaxID=1872532 RepID=UPI00388FC3BA